MGEKGQSQTMIITLKIKEMMKAISERTGKITFLLNASKAKPRA